MARPRGLFINPTKAQCSIHESGRMMYACLKLSRAYDLDYLEVDAEHHPVGPGYDFYAFNYHHVTMAWLNTQSVRKLPGLKLTFVLEVNPGDPFVLCPKDDFDAYLPLDPSLVHSDPRVFPVPRPLEIPRRLPHFQEPDIPSIGTFGFATPGKGFELVVDAVGREFERARVRINVPPSTYADPATHALQGMPYSDYLERLCHQVARPGIEVEFTRQYMDEVELIEWCARNTLNCFLYNRNQPGLSATTDQAIAACRPLAVSANPTFRHIHPYLTPYPFRSLRESIAQSLPEVMDMQQDWGGTAFATRFEEILSAHGLLPAPASTVRLRTIEPEERTRILLVNHPQKQCGIHQYGVDFAEAMSTSRKYLFEHVECSSIQDLEVALERVQPRAVLYNHYPFTMPWLNPEFTRDQRIPQVGIMHEVTQDDADCADTSLFDAYLCPDPTLIPTNPICHVIPRLIPTYINTKPLPKTPIIGTFGFAFSDKGFERIVDRVQEEFDEAIILIHAPKNDLVESDAEAILNTCRARLSKPGIQIVANTKFLTKQQLLELLSSVSINVFFYDEYKNKGISSAVEKAMAVQRPVAVNRAGMFRHLHKVSPSVCIEDRSLRSIMNTGISPLVPFFHEWSPASFLRTVESTFDKILAPSLPRKEASASKIRHEEPQPSDCATTGVQPNNKERILWVPGANPHTVLLATATLTLLKKLSPNVSIQAAVPREFREYFSSCPYLDEVLAYDSARVAAAPQDLAGLRSRLEAFAPTLALALGEPGDPTVEAILAACKAPRILGFGPMQANSSMTETVAPESTFESEQDRHARLLGHLGLPPPDSKPEVWIPPEIEARVEDMLRSLGLAPSNLVVLEADGPLGPGCTPAWPEAVAGFIADHGFNLVVTGRDESVEAGGTWAARIPGSVNLCGCLTPLEHAALFKTCLLAAGTEGPWVHLASAARIPHAIALGGGTFGRYAPYSPESVCAVLPLGCFGCQWQCQHDKPHCLEDLASPVLRSALEEALHGSRRTPHLCIQDGLPEQILFPSYLDLPPMLDAKHVRWEIVTRSGSFNGLNPRDNEPTGATESPCSALICIAEGDPELLRDWLSSVRVGPRNKWIITSLLSSAERLRLAEEFGHKALFIDGTPFRDRGPNMGLNLAFYKARDLGFSHAIVIRMGWTPENPRWYQHLDNHLRNPACDLGIFASLAPGVPDGLWELVNNVPLPRSYSIRIRAIDWPPLNPGLTPDGAAMGLALAMRAKRRHLWLLPLSFQAMAGKAPSADEQEFTKDLELLRAQYPSDRLLLGPCDERDVLGVQRRTIRAQGCAVDASEFRAGAECLEGTEKDPEMHPLPARQAGFLALLLPSKGRLVDLLLTLALVPLRPPRGLKTRFFVCANYPTWQLFLLKVIFWTRATFLDERRLPASGMTGAYNHAYDLARVSGADWVALWADDLLPERNDWLRRLWPILTSPGFHFGIFSSDEGHHKGRWGWNIFAGYPCAHFFVARTNALPGYMLTPKLRAYVSDNEIAIGRIKSGVPVHLVPVKVIHQPTTNPTRSANTPNYLQDLHRFYDLHPELRGKLDGVVLKGDVRDGSSAFIPDRGEVVRFNQATLGLSLDTFLNEAPRAAIRWSVKTAGKIRTYWNEVRPLRRAQQRMQVP